MTTVEEIPQENLTVDALKVTPEKKQRKKRSKKLVDEATAVAEKKAKAPKLKKDRSLRAIFRSKLRDIDIERLKKPWMAAKSFRLITTEQQLSEYVDGILSDRSCWVDVYRKGVLSPVVAVDTETHGLDTRVIIEFEAVYDKLGNVTYEPIYELNIEIAGVCLSADGITGVYIPIFHEDGQNVPIEAASYHLQRLFDQAHLVFYHAKFDREVLRQTMAIKFRPYPHFEDVQVLHYINDPKADMGDDTFSSGGEGLKGLSKEILEFEQIELSEIGKVKAHIERSADEIEEEARQPEWKKFAARKELPGKPVKKRKERPKCACGNEATYTRKDAVLGLDDRVIYGADGVKLVTETFECDEHLTKPARMPKKTGQHMQYVPFTWIPTPIALWYAAADAICTWLLWEKMHEEAQGRRNPHYIDGQLVDTLSWIERQRLTVDTERHARLSRWTEKIKAEKVEHLRQLANEAGWQDSYDEHKKLIPDTQFNVKSMDDLSRLLFEIKGYMPVKFTDTGKASCDVEVLGDLLKLHPHDEFLIALQDYREYSALHPEKLAWDKRDNSARIYLKQAVVAGGRLAASGGKFGRDGGVSINIQAVKKVEGNWWVNGNLLLAENIAPDSIPPHEESDLDASCFREVAKDEVWAEGGEVLTPDHPEYAKQADLRGFKIRNGKWTKKAPGIINNHLGCYFDYYICLVPGCKTCADLYGLLLADTRADANQIVNMRALFVAPADDWTFLTTDYSNIEVRVAANVSGEPELIKIFLEGSGDHHSLTASKVFPEFNDPNTSKARKKYLRGLAKIINFALQYGGTEYTIFENLKPHIPDITMQRAREMVEAYWRGVPVFERWSRGMQAEAKDNMTCTTAFNRVIKFESAMKERGIRKPTKEESDRTFEYYRKRKAYYALKAKVDDGTATQKEKESCESIKRQMDSVYYDPASGVRNAMDYNKFMSQIQRIAVNAPLQGLAGDIMRAALNAIYRWMHQDIGVQAVTRVHCSVHDEIDYACKNKYLPFVVPRFTRLMKLRKIHTSRKWPVPIEADTEYGHSWDVAYHLTGDSDSKPAGWTHVKGMEEYLPSGFTLSAVNNLLSQIRHCDEKIRDSIREHLKKTLHPRLADIIHYTFDAKDYAASRKHLFALLQLHEYWTVDETPESETDSMETLEEYEARCGLTPADRGHVPEKGWLTPVPLDRVRRKPIPILGPEPPPDAPKDEPASPTADPVAETPPPETPIEETPAYKELLADVSTLIRDADAAIKKMMPGGDLAWLTRMAEAEDNSDVCVGSPVGFPFLDAECLPDSFLEVVPKQAPDVEWLDEPPAKPATEQIEEKEMPASIFIPVKPGIDDDLLHPSPKRRRVEKTEGEPVLRDMDLEEMKELLQMLGHNQGDKTLTVRYMGQSLTLDNLHHTNVPEKYLA